MERIKEEWKLLTNVDKNQFYISSLGRIVNGETKFFVRPYIHKSRANYYLRVALGDKKFFVHILVALAYHAKPSPDHVEVHHIDFNTLNPAATNVMWTTKNHNKSEMWRAKRVVLPFEYGSFTAATKPFKGASAK